MPAQTHRTDDMAQAAYLSMNGQTYVMEREGDSCVWCFEFGSDLPLVKSYQCGAARVEPKRFIREVTHVRREMYSFLEAAA